MSVSRSTASTTTKATRLNTPAATAAKGARGNEVNATNRRSCDDCNKAGRDGGRVGDPSVICATNPAAAASSATTGIRLGAFAVGLAGLSCRRGAEEEQQGDDAQAGQVGVASSEVRIDGVGDHVHHRGGGQAGQRDPHRVPAGDEGEQQHRAQSDGERADVVEEVPVVGLEGGDVVVEGAGGGEGPHPRSDPRANTPPAQPAMRASRAAIMGPGAGERARLWRRSRPPPRSGTGPRTPSRSGARSDWVRILVRWVMCSPP
jgi:hypothetical protein